MMQAKRVTVYLVKAFGFGADGGNPAGVVLDADGMTASQKQRVAAQIGYSETAFVRGSDKADFGVDFFTPVRQIPNCGHATIATAALMRQKKLIGERETRVETLNGVGSIRFEGETVFMEQRPVGQWSLAPDEQRELLESLGLRPDQALGAFSPRVVSTGNKFFLLGVRGPEELAALRPDFARIAALSARHDAVGYYVFALLDDGERAATTRMFAPSYGIDEESATGMAAGPLAWMLSEELGLAGDELCIEQGRFMKPASLSMIQARIFRAEGRVESLLIGGRGFVAAETSVVLA